MAVATMMMDPVMTQCAELMRRKKMLGKKQIEAGDGWDVMKVDLPSQIKI